VKRISPAGGVYFFEIAEGSASGLADRWLESVSDDEQDRRDGFGLAAWGVW
jgi:CRISPR-associated protein Cmr3